MTGALHLPLPRATLPTGWLGRPCTPSPETYSVVPKDRPWVGLVSYPRSGNTWLRFLLTHCLWPDATVSFQTLGRYVPDWHRQLDRHTFTDSKSPSSQLPFRVVKSHQIFNRYFDKRIYLYRDGRDALTAYYYWLQGRDPSPPPWRES